MVGARRAVVLDRDGVINDNSRWVHVHSPAQFVLFAGAAEAIRGLNEHDFLVLVATNQGGVGLGYMSVEQLDDIHQFMLQSLAEARARIDGIAACTHAPKAGCACRKPRPGMLEQLQREFGFAYQDSFMVGDRDTDIAAGHSVGMRTVHIGVGPSEADHQAPSLLAAVPWILSEQSPT